MLFSHFISSSRFPLLTLWSSASQASPGQLNQREDLLCRLSETIRWFWSRRGSWQRWHLTQESPQSCQRQLSPILRPHPTPKSLPAHRGQLCPSFMSNVPPALGCSGSASPMGRHSLLQQWPYSTSGSNPEHLDSVFADFGSIHHPYFWHCVSKITLCKRQDVLVLLDLGRWRLECAPPG